MEYVIIIGCLLASAFFSGLEIAFISSNRMYIELEKKQGSFSASLLSKLTDNPRKFITTMLVGNSLALIVYTMYMDHLLKDWIKSHIQINEVLLNLVVVIISTIIILVLAEFLPKSIFSVYSNKLLIFFSVPLYIVTKILSPFVSFVTWISTGILKLLGVKIENEEKSFDRKDLEFFIDEHIDGTEEEELDSEIQIFQNALDFNEIKARECMIPRKEMVALELQTPIEELIEKFTQTGLSKIVIYRDSIDNVIGYVHSFELFKKPEFIKNILMPIEFVHEATPAKEVMNRLTKKRKSIAIVLDEYGGTSGMITTEDVVEELFGEIEDEHDKVILKEEQISDTEYIFSARLEIDYLNTEYKLDLEEDESYETLGGYLMSLLEDIPNEGEKIETEKYSFLIQKISKTRIEEVLLTEKNVKNEA